MQPPHSKKLAAPAIPRSVCQLTTKSSQKFDRRDNFSRLSGLVVKLLSPLPLLFQSLSLSLSLGLSVREIPVGWVQFNFMFISWRDERRKRKENTRGSTPRLREGEKIRKEGRKRERERERGGQRGNRRGNDNVAVTRNETKRKCMRGDPPPHPCYPSARRCNCVETSFGASRPRDSRPLASPKRAR